MKYQSRLRGLALLDAGIPGITLPDAIPTDPEQAWKTWHFAFHLVPDLPETLHVGREREYVGWFLKVKALSSDTFDDVEIEQYAASVAAGGGLIAASIRPWADHATGIVVPDAGHFIPDEQPDAVAAALTDFITEGD